MQAEPAFDAATHDGLATPQRTWAVLSVSLAVILAVMDGAMINIAIPSIARDLHASPEASIWVVNAFQLALAVALLPVGKLADTYGHRRVYLACALVFLAGSLLCAVSNSLLTLAMGRFVQGLGGAGVMGVSNALLRFVYPTALLGRGIGMNALVAALALASAPTVASSILAIGPWQWLFYANLPAGVLLLLVGWNNLPAKTPRSGSFDGPSAIMSVVALGALLLALDGVAHGLSLIAICLAVAVGGVVSVMLVRRQVKTPSPLLPLDLFAHRPYALAVLILFCSSTTQLMAYVAAPYFFQHVLLLTPVQTGLAFTPWPLMVAVASPISGRLSSHVAPGLLCSLGMLILGLGLALLPTLSVHASAFDIGWRMGVCGFGYGVFLPPNSRALISSVPMARSANAGSMGATGRAVGQATGAALVAMLFRLFPDTGMSMSILVAAAIALAAAGANLLRGFKLTPAIA